MSAAVPSPESNMPIAIVGIGCRFPGGVHDAAGFWRLLIDGVDAITDIPASRFDIDAYYDPKPGTRGRIMTKFGGFVDQPLEEFDATFFGISRSYAERLDPQQRLLLETSWEAMEDAGVDIVGLRGTPTGIFVGQWVSDFEHRLFDDTSGIDFQMAMGTGRYAAAGRLSYAFGFRGPSLSIDAACSSGLASVHLAVRSLRSGDSKVALAGGVNMILQPHIHLAYSYSRMMAPDGRCRFGDASGAGYVRAEGAGMVVLKPLADALADGDRVYAVIRGSAVNNDGDSSGSMGRPSRIGQEELIRSALRDGNVHASQLDYVEAHGTGTRAGDPVELGALATVLAGDRPPDAARTWVGSVKTNIGHTEAAAGIAGLIKAALMLQHRMIPPSLHFNTPNVDVAWDSIPIAIPTTLTPWPERDGAVFAGISSYGIGGTNAHVVLESAPVDGAAAALRQAVPVGTPAVLPISARSKAGLRAVAAQYAALLGDFDIPVYDLCAAAATRRSALTHRAAFVAVDRDAMRAALRDFSAGGPATVDGIVYDRAPRRVAFVVPGQGAQWTGMAREFMACEPVFRSALEACDAAARAHVSWSIIEQLKVDPAAHGYLGDRIDVIQPTLVALAIAYAAWFRSIGIEPDAVVGHSLGEVGAAAIAGVIDIATAMRIICARSALLQRTSGKGAMAVVELSRIDAVARIAAHADRVSVAVENGPRSSVISGDPDAVQEIVASLQRDGLFARLVQVDVASHSAQMEPLVPELVASLTGLQTCDAAVPLYSTVLGARATGIACDAEYWGRNLREPVQFATVVSNMIDDGIDLFVELGPHPVLTQAVEQVAHAAGKDVYAVACGRRDTSDLTAVRTAVAALWAHGGDVSWRAAMPWRGRHVALPFYPWQRERFWVDAGDLHAATRSEFTGAPALDTALRASLYTHEFQAVQMSATPEPRATRRWVVVSSGRVTAATALASELQQRGADVSVVEHMPDAGAAVGDGVRATDDIAIVVLPARDAELAYAPVRSINEVQGALRAAGSALTARIWWLTCGAHSVRGHGAAANSAQAAASWGAARVIAEEHPAWWGGVIDLASGADLAREARSVAEFLTAACDEDQVALRDGVVFAPRLVPLPPQASLPFRWRTDAAYLLTGGFGGLATRIATTMVAQGARRLVLLARTPLPPRAEWERIDPISPAGRRVSAVRALEHAGASVHVMCADVADEAAMRDALERYRAEGWPPIDGVVHAAGTLDNRLTGALTQAQFAHVMAAKVTGCEVLDRLLPDVGLFVTCSSIMAFLGLAGMANYAAANAGVDAVVAMRRARGRHAVSVQWCVWRDTGMVDDAQMRRNVDEMMHLGLRAISPDEGVSCFAVALSRPEAVIAVLPIDWSILARARGGRVQPLFRAIPEAMARSDAPDEWTLPIAAASGAARRELLETLVRTVVSDLLRRPAAQINAREAFGTLGVDSLLALEIRNRLQSALQRPLSATLTWNYNTVASLAAHLSDELASRLAPVAAAVVAANVPAEVDAPAIDGASLLDAMGGLSDDDALLALRRRR